MTERDPWHCVAASLAAATSAADLRIFGSRLHFYGLSARRNVPTCAREELAAGRSAIWRTMLLGGVGNSRGSMSVTGMFNVQEVKIQTRGPDKGNPTSTRQELRRGAPRLSGRDANAQGRARGSSKEVIDAWRNRMRVKCRKARATGEPAHSGNAQYLSVVVSRIGNEFATKCVETYPVRSVGFRESGSR